MFGKVFAGIAMAGILAGVLATGAMAATPSATKAASPTTKQRPAPKDVVAGTVTAINETQLTIKNAKAGSKIFLRTDATIVVKGRNEKAVGLRSRSTVTSPFATRPAMASFMRSACTSAGRMSPVESRA